MIILLTWQEITGNELFQSVVASVIKVLGGLFLVWIVFKLINIISRKLESRLSDNVRVDVTIASFITPLLRKILKFFVIICYIGFIGIETSSIAAAITSAGLAIGLALQGSLSNFAGGFIILIMRPFKVGDYITTCGESGTVESIQLFYTTLVTPDNKVIKIPNGELANSSIVDFSSKSIRRVDFTFSISYKNDFDKTKNIIQKCINKIDMVLSKPEKPFIGIINSYTYTIDIVVRVWVKKTDYWSFYFSLLENVKKAFDENGIELPYSKVDVNLINK